MDTSKEPVPIAEIKGGRLRWHIPHAGYSVPPEYINNDTHYLYTRATLDAAVAEAVERERERWEEALRKTWRMVDPLRPAGTPGSYARGQDSGIVAALTTVRENATPTPPTAG